MKWGLSIAAFCAVLCSVAPTARAADNDGEAKLVKMVVLSRHGVRSPTQHRGELDAWSRRGWPEWPVKRGELTPRGAELVTSMWRQEAAFLKRTGLLPEKGCPEPGVIAVRADKEQRTEATAEAVLEGLAPGCGFKPVVNRSASIDPLFHPVEAGYCALEPSRIEKELSPKDIAALEQTLAAPVSELAALLGPASPEFCREHRLPENCTIADVPSRLTFGKDNQTVHLGGKLGMASSTAEIMLLEYAQWDRPAGWGTVDRGELEALLPVHSRVFDAVNRAPSVAASRGSELLLDMANALVGKYADPAVNKAKVVVFVGHDTNIANVAKLLSLNWHLSGYAPDEIPPASALALTLWERNGQYQVHAHLLAQSLETLHDPAMRGEPLREALEVPWCGSQAYEGPCSLTEFELLVRAVIRPECVRER